MLKRILVFFLSAVLAVGPAVAELPKYSNPTGCVSGEYYTHGGVYSQDACVVRPSFDLPLQTTLVPRWASGSGTPTYTRATTAYQIDFEGKHNLLPAGAARMQGARVVHNLQTFSEDFSNAVWNALTPSGSATASVITFTGAGNDYRYSTITVTSGRVYRISVELKAGTKTGIVVRGTNVVGMVLTLTSNFVRYSFLGTAVGGTQFGFDNRVGAGGDGIAGTINARNFQLEDVTGQVNQNPSEYVSVGVLSAPFHGLGADGIKAFDTLNGNTVASNVVTEATGAHIDSSQAACAGGVAAGVVDASGPLGYLAEGARADVLGATAAIRRTMSDVGWVNGGTMTVATTTGVDGVAAAGARLTGGAVTATNTILYTTVLGAAVRTYSAWVKRITGTGTIEMTKDGGVSWTDITVSLSTAVHKLVQVTTASAANPVVGFRITTNADSIDVDFNTLEAATFANPTPIPINVSKAADVLTYASAGNISGTQGNAVLDVSGGNSGVFLYYINSNSAGDASVLTFNPTSTKLTIYDGTTSSNDLAFSPSSTVQHIGSHWGGSSMRTFAGGSAGSGAVFDGALQVGTNFSIGTKGNGGVNTEPFGTIRNVRIYPKALSVTKLQQKTSFLYIPFLDNFQYMWAANDEQYRIVANAH